MKVLFVCTGNTCRSAMCEAYFNYLSRKNGTENLICAESAGTNAWQGDGASANAVAILSGLETDIARHSARRLTKEMVQEADMVIPMTGYHRDLILAMVPKAENKIHLLTEFLNASYGCSDINDPYAGDLESYAQCFQDIREPLERIYELFSKQKIK